MREPAVKDRGERSVCRKVPSVADSSAEHGCGTRESLKSTISLSPEPIREGHRSLSMVTYLASCPKLIGLMVENL
jgi:hypothetical protein